MKLNAGTIYSKGGLKGWGHGFANYKPSLRAVMRRCAAGDQLDFNEFEHGFEPLIGK